jgi:hypothetical protein
VTWTLYVNGPGNESICKAMGVTFDGLIKNLNWHAQHRVAQR